MRTHNSKVYKHTDIHLCNANYIYTYIHNANLINNNILYLLIHYIYTFIFNYRDIRL